MPKQQKMFHPARYGRAHHLPQRHPGAEEALVSHTYGLGPNQSETYARTTKAIANFVGKSYKNGGDVKRSMDQLRAITILPPDDLREASPPIPETQEDLTTDPPTHYSPAVPAVPPPSQTELRIWQKEIDE